MTTASAPVDVAVGVVIRPDGAVLLGQRPAGKPYAGWWEFPGGKLECGESVEAALARELDEELGLRVHGSCPWVVRRFVYPHATVRLHFRRVLDFEGEPHARERQAFAWRHPDAIDVAPLLPATVPVITWLRLPALCVPSAAAAMGERAFLDALEHRLGERRLSMLLLDEPSLPPARFEALFYPVAQACRAAGARLLVGDRHPPSFHQATSGVLLGAAALRALVGRPALPLVGAEVAGPADVERAGSLGLDFVVAPRPLPQAPGLPVYLRDPACPSLRAAIHAGAHGLACDAAFWQDD